MKTIVSFKHLSGKTRSRFRWMFLMVYLSIVSAAAGSAESGMPEFTDCQLTSKGSSFSIQAKCAEMMVLENPDDPEGRQIPIKIVIVPAKHRNKMPDPLFLLAGGPGQSISEAYPSMAGSFETIREDRDIILVDQRGTGGSNPLNCPSSNELLFSDEESILHITDCLKELGINPAFYTTRYFVNDLECVRKTLGYDQINLYGASYGTLAAQAYLERFPGRVRSMILDSVAHRGYKIFYDFRQTVPRALEKLFARCQADPDCNTAFPNLRESFFAILERLEIEAVPVRMKHPTSGELVMFDMTPKRFLQSVMPLLYAPETIALLPLTIHAASEFNDFEPLTGQVASVDMGIYHGLMFSVICAEDAPFFPPENEWPITGPFDYSSHTAMICRICADWNVPREVRLPNPIVSHVPVLFLSGDADPVTPPEFAEKAAQFFPDSLHIVVPHMAHGIINRGCVDEIATDFIRSGSAEGLDTSCTEKILPSPFFINLNGPKP